MSFTLEFVAVLGGLLLAAGPLVLALVILIAMCALIAGRIEGWGHIDSLYYGFVTATTVGFGDIRPTRGKCKVIAIVIAFLGLMMTGMIVALAVEAMTVAHDRTVTDVALEDCVPNSGETGFA